MALDGLQLWPRPCLYHRHSHALRETAPSHRARANAQPADKATHHHAVRSPRIIAHHNTISKHNTFCHLQRYTLLAQRTTPSAAHANDQHCAADVGQKSRVALDVSRLGTRVSITHIAEPAAGFAGRNWIRIGNATSRSRRRDHGFNIEYWQQRGLFVGLNVCCCERIAPTTERTKSCLPAISAMYFRSFKPWYFCNIFTTNHCRTTHKTYSHLHITV